MRWFICSSWVFSVELKERMNCYSGRMQIEDELMSSNTLPGCRIHCCSLLWYRLVAAFIEVVDSVRLLGRQLWPLLSCGTLPRAGLLPTWVWPPGPSGSHHTSVTPWQGCTADHLGPSLYSIPCTQAWNCSCIKQYHSVVLSPDSIVIVYLC